MPPRQSNTAPFDASLRVARAGGLAAKRRRWIGTGMTRMVKILKGADYRIDNALSCMRPAATVAPRWRGGGGWSAQRAFPAINSKICTRANSGRAEFSNGLLSRVAVHFGMYFCHDIWDRLRRIARQATKRLALRYTYQDDAGGGALPKAPAVTTSGPSLRRDGPSVCLLSLRRQF